MARPRSHLTALGKLLDSLDEPVYLVDEDRTILYCNRACETWTHIAVERLCGQVCGYHSSETVSGVAAVAAGLCPPPRAFSGMRTTGTVRAACDADPPSVRGAEFFPLGCDDPSCTAVLALVRPDDTGEALPRAIELGAVEPNAVALHDLVQRFRLEQAGRYALDRLLGSSPAACRARQQVEIAAQNDANVLVVGPAGSGRDHIARAIHYRRRGQASAPPLGDAAYGGTLAPVSCAVLGAELLQSTITALVRRASEQHEQQSQHAGIPGTLLLGDVDALLPESQAELAGFLGLADFSMRVISTTSAPLDSLVSQGKYRADLAQRLGTLVIELPPLAQRRDDLPLLAQMFLEEQNARCDKQLGGFSPDALDALDGYPWPGNLDELAEMVRAAHDAAQSSEITPADLPPRIRLAADAAAHPPREEETIVLDTFLADIERELVLRALRHTKGNKTKAARLLGLTRPRLYRRMQRMGLLEGEGPTS